MNPSIDEIEPPVVPLPQDPFIPRKRLQRLVNVFPGGQFFRYLMVGGFNTLFGFCTSVFTFWLLRTIPPKYLYLATPLASIISTPFNITVAYFGYKLFVFRTKGNHLIEWLKCFAVYGTGMIPGLVALGALTRFLQSQIHRHAELLHASLRGVESHLHGLPLRLLGRFAHGSSVAGVAALAIVIALSTIYSFVGHKKVTFKTSGTPSAATAAPLA